MSTWFTSGLWALVSLGGLGTGILLLVLGLKRRIRGNEPHCARCDYNLTGAASEVCPECGMPRTPETTVHGQRYRRPWLAVLGIMLVLGSSGLVPFLLKNQPAARRPVSASNSIRNAKMLIADMKTSFQAGEAQRGWGSGATSGTGQPDARMGILVLFVQNKTNLSIQRCGAGQAAKSAALTELQAANQLLTSQIVSAYNAAAQSKRPADAQALVPLMDRLDKHMDKLLQILKGH